MLARDRIRWAKGAAGTEAEVDVASFPAAAATAAGQTDRERWTAGRGKMYLGEGL